MSSSPGQFQVSSNVGPFNEAPFYGTPLTTFALENATQQDMQGNYLYATPWFTGKGGAISHVGIRVGNAQAASRECWFGVYAVEHSRVTRPTTCVHSQQLTWDINSGDFPGAHIFPTPGLTVAADAVRYLCILPNTTCELYRPDGEEVIGTLGVDVASAHEVYTGLVASYDYASGMPATFPSSVAFLGSASGAPIVGVRYG